MPKWAQAADITQACEYCQWTLVDLKTLSHWYDQTTSSSSQADLLACSAGQYGRSALSLARLRPGTPGMCNSTFRGNVVIDIMKSSHSSNPSTTGSKFQHGPSIVRSLLEYFSN